VITEQRDRWLAAGAPAVPTLVVDGTSHVLQHPSDAGALLGLETPPPLGDARQVAWDVDEVVGAWLQLLETTPWEVLLEPLPRLARTPLDLGVDTLVGIAALTDAFATGWFHWPGNPDTGVTGDAAVVAYQDSVVETIRSRKDLLGFAQPVARAWRQALLDHDDALQSEPGRPMRAPRGDLPWVRLLEAQRLHAAQHFRQATTFLTSRGQPLPKLDLADLQGLELPRFVY
jgi:hypothetical protein